MHNFRNSNETEMNRLYIWFKNINFILNILYIQKIL